MFQFKDTVINLLDVSEAPSLIHPATVASRDAGHRFQFTLAVDDVDAMVAELRSRGVEILNGPIDRPWGIRTASFEDPGRPHLGDREVGRSVPAIETVT